MNNSVRLAETTADLETCLRLRWAVFVEEQGVPPSLEVDEHDRRDPGGAVHALALLGTVPAGAARFIFVKPGVAKIQRMAVVDDARKRGLGRDLLRFLEAEARRRGATAFTLDAQVTAQVFYEREGYVASAERFNDAGIAHVRMNKAA